MINDYTNTILMTKNGIMDQADNLWMYREKPFKIHRNDKNRSNRKNGVLHNDIMEMAEDLLLVYREINDN